MLWPYRFPLGNRIEAERLARAARGQRRVEHGNTILTAPRDGVLTAKVVPHKDGYAVEVNFLPLAPRPGAA